MYIVHVRTYMYHEINGPFLPHKHMNSNPQCTVSQIAIVWPSSKKSGAIPVISVCYDNQYYNVDGHTYYTTPTHKLVSVCKTAHTAHQQQDFSLTSRFRNSLVPPLGVTTQGGGSLGTKLTTPKYKGSAVIKFQCKPICTTKLSL